MKNIFESIQDKITEKSVKENEEQRRRIDRLRELNEKKLNKKGLHIPHPIQAVKDNREKKELEKAILDDWDERKRLFASEVPENNFLEFISCMMSVSIRVLIEKFHWKPVPKDGYYDRRLAIVRFSDYVQAEIDMISGDEMQDIRKYNEETFNLYGVKFAAEFEE